MTTVLNAAGTLDVAADLLALLGDTATEHRPDTQLEALTLAVSADLPVLLWGEPGIGKTAALNHLADSLGRDRGTDRRPDPPGPSAGHRAARWSASSPGRPGSTSSWTTCRTDPRTGPTSSTSADHHHHPAPTSHVARLRRPPSSPAFIAQPASPAPSPGTRLIRVRAVGRVTRS
ncbi:hypothetical protein AMIS_58330 [Actinoplanes missouriensis 431]|uniref:Uncharacterized protein n=1 Tax=Actinoplanes missouriensis (strain ATCC 14538 / DSM 43046 / CBS 188.64 / JCM 3121 / NBRC 102363 / NCIMB 12654 / NRRL B-3342 / UNCC 431) TaxID=512565 RepID=I0HDG6_ACTM4|nr:ATP-binding protein [Actinoplanes missouriensis]BAL91053.1 hypothetical protein AMIS_58330 [Actinoplanes missouriensis 431]